MSDWQEWVLFSCAGGAVGLLYYISTVLEKIHIALKDILLRVAQQRGEGWAFDDD